jgi:hypothetical protein
MGKYLRISPYIRKPVLNCNCSTLNFPYIYGKFDFLFYQCNIQLLPLTFHLIIVFLKFSSALAIVDVPAIVGNLVVLGPLFVNVPAVGDVTAIADAPAVSNISSFAGDPCCF